MGARRRGLFRQRAVKKCFPVVGCISDVLVRAFAVMVRRPDEWLTAQQLVAETGAAKSTIYERFGNLTAARVLVARRQDDFRQFKLHPKWRDSGLAAKLHQRCIDRGYLKASASES